jgi:ketosteroid isomerase-like protein
MTPSILLIIAALAWPVPAAAQTGPSLASRVQRLEDTEEIRTLLLDYGRYLDARDFAAYSRLFAKDGEWAGGFGTVQGPAAIQAFMEKNIPGPNRGNTYHILSNFIIEVHGDTATAWSRWAFVTPGADNKPAIAQGGHYDDTLVRENGHWKFKRRVAASDIPVPKPAASAPIRGPFQQGSPGIQNRV